ncbi:MAG: type II toxin-antitoxin system VapC family toxin [Candidatus Cyclonatronum sp.]|uniref:type II toxin-antitoxin system VapC family toxin n=1 Tax=Cyclonatronum sp. TaxID=3024185 RepID=UPI0025B9CE99|nr:type II toxin-antitoxin system VapC family toxin [Cyclonatronum sp.]MCC5935516.1 type II toxin-antitoxin system VapC family toxin [Balneolales bacterium]MCH8487593.1 type II toxin-antitoxin system VapC family toxin [Cyclonatronum sp.]
MLYLLDTNICIYFMKGLFDLKTKFMETGPENCFISEITLAELKFGVQKSQAREKNQKALQQFLSGIQILPIMPGLDIYAFEKARLQKARKPVDDFDLLIGATAVYYNLILVTNNRKHFERLENIRLEDWTTKN